MRGAGSAMAKIREGKEGMAERRGGEGGVYMQDVPNNRVEEKVSYVR